MTGRVPGALRLGRVLMAVLLTAAMGGCKKSRPADETPHFHESILAGLKRQGFTVGAFAATEAGDYDAAQCVRGAVDRLDVLLCRYQSAEAAQAAKKKLTGFARGAVSGAARQSGILAIAVADRDKVDLQGKQISRLLRAFTGEPPKAR